MARGTLVALATLIVLSIANVAEASQVSIDPATGGTTFAAGPEENNRLSIRYTTINDDDDTGTPEVDVIEFTDYESVMTITDATRCRLAFDDHVATAATRRASSPPARSRRSRGARPSRAHRRTAGDAGRARRGAPPCRNWPARPSGRAGSAVRQHVRRTPPTRLEAMPELRRLLGVVREPA